MHYVKKNVIIQIKEYPADDFDLDICYCHNHDPE